MSKEKKTDKTLVAFDDTLNAIKAAAQTLNRAADEASSEIEALEQELLDIEPGVNVWTDVLFTEPMTHVGASGSQNGVRSLRLGYLKGKKGGLVVRDDVVAPDGTMLRQEELPLRKAERETRLFLRSHLPDVLNLVLNTLNAQVARLPAPPMPDPEALIA